MGLLSGLSRGDAEFRKFVSTLVGSGTAVKTVSDVDWREVLFDPVSSAPDFVGLHEVEDASTTDLNWVVLKIEGSRISKRKGAWSNRVSLFV